MRRSVGRRPARLLPFGLVLAAALFALPGAATPTPGPDAGGYVGRDNVGAGAAPTGKPLSDWTSYSIATSGTNVPWSTACAGSGNYSNALTLPWSFKFYVGSTLYSGTQNQVHVSRHGYLAFPSDWGPNCSAWPFTALPNTGDDPSLIMGLSTSLANTGTVKYKASTFPAHGYQDAWVAQWTGVTFYGNGACGSLTTGSGSLSMQIRLYRTTNVIETELQTVTQPSCNSTPISAGIQNEHTGGSSGGNIGLSYKFDSSAPLAGLTVPSTIQYRPPGVVQTGVADAYTMDRQVTPTTFEASNAFGPSCVVGATTGVLCNDGGIGTVTPRAVNVAAITPAGSTVTMATGPGCSGASPSINPGGGFCYTPPANYCGPGGFTYQPQDDWGTGAAVTVTFTIVGCNKPPIAAPDAYLAVEDTPTIVSATAPVYPSAPSTCPAGAGVLCNDYDPDGCGWTPAPCGPSPITMDTVPFAAPANGAVAGLTTGGAFQYSPAGNFCGLDTWQYRAYDGPGPYAAYSAPAVVTMTVSCTPDLPTAVNDAYTTPDGQTLTAGICSGLVKGVRCNDSDPDGPGSGPGQLLDDDVELVTGLAQAASFTLNADGTFTYTPNLGFVGVDCFTYRLRDDGYAPAQFSGTAQACITVTPVPPDVADDAYQVAADFMFDSAARGWPPVLANDDDIDEPDPFDVDLVTDPVVAGAGSLTMLPNGHFQYTPPTGFTGLDTFTYRAEDSYGLFSAYATVTLDVVENNPPNAFYTPGTTEAGPGEMVVFFDGSWDPDPNDMVVSWHWDFGDGFTQEGLAAAHAFAGAGSYSVCLTVHDSWGFADMYCKVVTVGFPAQVTEQTYIAAPHLVAYAGEDLTVREGTTVVLHGEANGGVATIWQWSQLSGEPLALSALDKQEVSFKAPFVPGADALRLDFSLRVGDGNMMSLPSLMRVFVVSGNTPPRADAGHAIEAHEGDVLTLDAGRSSDADGDAITFEWRQASGVPAKLEGATAAQATVTVPEGAVGTVLVFAVKVADGKHANTDAVQVLVLPQGYSGPGFRMQADLEGMAQATPEVAGAQYVWDWGDGTTSVSAGPTGHAYAASGTYDVTMTVRNADGTSRSFAGRVEVVVPDSGAQAAQTVAEEGSSLAWLAWAGLGAGLLLVAVAAVLLARRRRKAA